MTELRILFTGAGRRVELLQAFRQAALRLSVRLKLYGADMAGTAPALAFCDQARKICAMKEADYIPQLLEICRKDRIDLLIPTIDTDLLVLSENRERFEAVGTKVMISSPDKVALCRDKSLTTAFFRSCGLKAPVPVDDWRKYQGPYPCFIKPKDGSSSIDAYRVERPGELSAYAERVQDYIIQPFIEGAEYTVDLFCDFSGNPIYITPRLRLAVRGGEVLKTKIALDKRMKEECRRLACSFRPRGAITVQLIREKASGEDYYIEINPRYGGGAPLSIRAGADSAEMTLRLLLGEEIPYQEQGVRDGAVYSRFDQSVCIASESREAEGAGNKISGVIFDLDDTLYPERQYVKSGFLAVARLLGDAGYGERLWRHFLEGKNAIDALLRETGREEEKEACLRAYREHEPDISLYEGMEELLRDLRKKGIRVGILTDGRPFGQRAKIRALGLDELVEDILVTDELGGEQFRKPCDIAFRILQRRWRLPFEELLYVGDNPDKDFQAPMQLGMRSLYVENPEGLYFREGAQAEDLTVRRGAFHGQGVDLGKFLRGLI